MVEVMVGEMHAYQKGTMPMKTLVTAGCERRLFRSICRLSSKRVLLIPNIVILVFALESTELR